jgi:DNA (cytosine-5)-methyltransferase 1
MGNQVSQKKFGVVDLFSGAGGMSCGFRRHGAFEILGAADLEVAKPSHGPGATNCNSTYERNHGLRPANVNLATTEPEELAKHFGFSPDDVDVLISCAPCTGFSQKQSRNHVKDDSRNQLVRRTAVFAAAWRPKYILIENVKELLVGKHRHHFDSLREDLIALGYEVSAEVHDLSKFGLPQRRLRALVVAKLGGSFSPVLPTIDRVRTVRDVIADLPPIAAGECDVFDPMHVCPTMAVATRERMQAIPHDGGSWIDIPQEKAHLRIPSMNVDKPGSFPDVYGRLSWDKPAPTITRECSSPGNGRYTHPDQDRLLSVREMSLLQGYPSDYVFTGSLSSRYRQIGDAVPPLISALLAEAVADDAGLEAPVGLECPAPSSVGFGDEQMRLAL